METQSELEQLCQGVTGTPHYANYTNKKWMRKKALSWTLHVLGNQFHKECVQSGEMAGFVGDPERLRDLLQVIPELAWQTATVLLDDKTMPQLAGKYLQLTPFGLLELFGWRVDSSVLRYLVSAVAGVLPPLPPPPTHEDSFLPRLVSLDPASDEYQLEAARFCDCRISGIPEVDGAVFKVRGIKRVEHPFSQLVFSQYRKELESKIRSEGYRETSRMTGFCPTYENPVNEKILYHGTRKSSPETLATSFDGIDPKFATEGCRFGAGAYFAESPLYSDAYTGASTSSSTRTMLVVRVMCGRSMFYGDSGDPSLRSAPPGYDSVCGLCEKRARPITMFVVYDNRASLITHIIEYEPLERSPRHTIATRKTQKYLSLEHDPIVGFLNVRSSKNLFPPAPAPAPAPASASVPIPVPAPAPAPPAPRVPPGLKVGDPTKVAFVNATRPTAATLFTLDCTNSTTTTAPRPPSPTLRGTKRKSQSTWIPPSRGGHPVNPSANGW